MGRNGKYDATLNCRVNKYPRIAKTFLGLYGTKNEQGTDKKSPEALVYLGFLGVMERYGTGASGGTLVVMGGIEPPTYGL